MGKRNTRESDVTIGLDLGDKWSDGVVLDAQGEIVERARVRSTPKGFDQPFAGYEGARLVLEVGTHSPWASRRFTARGFEVIVANPRRVRLIAQGDSKTDEFDAELLARLGRVDPNLLSPIVHRGEAAQRDLSLIRSRDGLVRARTQLINQVRGFSKSLGIRLPGSSTEAFPRRVAEAVGREVFPGCPVLLEMVEQLTGEIRRMDREIERLCQERYPETARLRQVKGVGPITALCFVLTLEDPDRFETSRAVGAYLGLRPKLRNSGAHEPQLRITKGGDVLLRRLLVSGGQYILGPFGPDTNLRRFGLALSERGGKAAKKRAVVAVARKLAVLLHRLWVTGESYQPVGYAESRRRAAAWTARAQEPPETGSNRRSERVEERGVRNDRKTPCPGDCAASPDLRGRQQAGSTRYTTDLIVHRPPTRGPRRVRMEAGWRDRSKQVPPTQIATATRKRSM